MPANRASIDPVTIELINAPPDFEVEPETPHRPSNHFSFSRLAMWMRCSLQYKFRYVDNLIARPALALSNGRAGHTAVEYNAQHKVKTGLDRPLPELLDLFSDSYDAEVSELEPTDLKDGESIGETKDATVSTLTLFHRKVAPTITPHRVEQEFRLVIEPTEEHDFPIEPIVGRIDSIQSRPEDDHPLAIAHTETIDHKFRRQRGHPEEADYSDQLTLYDMVSTRAGIQTKNLGFLTFLPPTTRQPPRVEATLRSPILLTPKVREARHDRLLYKIRTVARAIKNGTFVPTDDPKTCSWCGYREMCQYSLVRDDYTAMQIRQHSGEPTP